MENGPFIDDFPIKTSIYKGFSMAMLNNQMVIINYESSTVNWGLSAPLEHPEVRSPGLLGASDPESRFAGLLGCWDGELDFPNP